jgi:hypothetical protein
MLATSLNTASFAISSNCNLEFTISMWIYPTVINSTSQSIWDLTSSANSKKYSENQIGSTYTINFISDNGSGTTSIASLTSNLIDSMLNKWIFVTFEYNPYSFKKVLVLDSDI